jgi:hypothetical protein
VPVTIPTHLWPLFSILLARRQCRVTFRDTSSKRSSQAGQSPSGHFLSSQRGASCIDTAFAATVAPSSSLCSEVVSKPSEHFVKPAIYDEVIRRLLGHGKVLLCGQPGLGKSTFAQDAIPVSTTQDLPKSALIIHQLNINIMCCICIAVCNHSCLPYQ